MRVGRGGVEIARRERRETLKPTARHPFWWTVTLSWVAKRRCNHVSGASRTHVTHAIVGSVLHTASQEAVPSWLLVSLRAASSMQFNKRFSSCVHRGRFQLYYLVGQGENRAELIALTAGLRQYHYIIPLCLGMHCAPVAPGSYTVRLRPGSFLLVVL